MSVIIQAFLQYEKQQPNVLFLHQPMETGVRTWTWKQAGQEARKITAALQGLGLQKGDRVALLSKNCAEWILADLAMLLGGFVSVPLYATITAPSIRMLLEHSGSKAVIIGKLDYFEEQSAGLMPDIPSIFIGAYGHDESLLWENLLDKYEPVTAIENSDSPETLLTIIYTSGTTGKPKGVMHTVKTIDATMTANRHIGIPKGVRTFSFLPLSHIAERVGIEFSTIINGGTIHFSHSLERFGSDLSAIQPDLFFAVPRIWAKFREKVNEKLPDQKLERLLKIPIIRSLVKKKIQKGMGLSKAKLIFSGAAPISVDMMLWYQKIGIEILQAYGMTEDCILGHFNLPGHNKLGTVGRPLPGLDVRISDEGEIQVKSGGLTVGYYREPEQTADLFTEDGYLKTGDEGACDTEGYLTITGRTKDLFKTDKGKYIAPAPIEMRLTDDNDIEQACVVGMGIPQPIGLVVLSKSVLHPQQEEMAVRLTKIVKRINQQLEHHERLEKMVVMQQPWTIENGLMTPSFKVKRNEVEKMYRDQYVEWFHKTEKIIWL